MLALEALIKWKPFVKRRVGIKRASKLVEATKKCIGIEISLRFAKKELRSLLEQFDLYQNQLKDLDQELEDLIQDVPGDQEMIDIKGIGVTTVATFFAEIGDIKKYSHPQ